MTYNTIDNDVTMAGGAEGALGRIDKYELRRELGEGGFGTVYLARDTVADVDVAVKGLPPEVKHNAVELESVRGNFALVKRLRHPNIVAVTDLHQAMSVSYASKEVESKLRVFERDTMVVMDYAPGVTLAQWRRQFPGGKVSVDKAIAVTRQVASALDYAHAQKVLHRDVKPANVMVESADAGKLVARVLDFGLAAEIRSSMGRLSREIRDTSGTRPYMAPEQWKGERQGPATDQYALAAMFYELVVGDVPFASVFDCGDPAVMRIAVTTDAPAIPSDFPKCVRRALSVALAKKPEDRFSTCGEFVAALEGKKVSRRGSETQREIGAGKVLAVLALAAVVGVGGWIYHQNQERHRAEQERQEAESAAAAKAAAQKAEAARMAEEARKAEDARRELDEKRKAIETAKLKIAVDAIYVEARVQMGACGRLDSSDGFKFRIEDCQKSFDRAEAQYDIGNWADAALAFTNVVDDCKALIEQSKARDKAKAVADALADAIKAAQDVGAKEYASDRFNSASELAKHGRDEFDAFKFLDAATTYTSAKSQFDLAAKEAEQAKHEEARKKRESEVAAQREEAERRERKAREAAAKATAEPAERNLFKSEHKGVQLWEGGPYWAVTNIGAENPEDPGYYFWWGDTVGYKREGDSWVASDGSMRFFSFEEKNAPTANKSSPTLRSEGWINIDGVLSPEHDAAHVKWGDNWRMPTKIEIEDLIDKCDWIRSGGGYTVRGRGGYASYSIYLPCTGIGIGTSLGLIGPSSKVGSYGVYWSSIPYSDRGNYRREYSWYLGFVSDRQDTRSYPKGNREGGMPIRPVQRFATQRSE